MKWFKTAMQAWWAYTLLAVLVAISMPRAEAAPAGMPMWAEKAEHIGTLLGCMELNMANFEEYEFFKDMAMEKALEIHKEVTSELKRKSAVLYVNAGLINFRKWEPSMQKAYCFTLYAGHP